MIDVRPREVVSMGSARERAGRRARMSVLGRRRPVLWLVALVASAFALGCGEKRPALPSEELKRFRSFVARLESEVWTATEGTTGEEPLVTIEPSWRRFFDGLRRQGATELRVVGFDVELGLMVDLPLERKNESVWVASFAVTSSGPVLIEGGYGWSGTPDDPGPIVLHAWPPGAEALERATLGLWQYLIGSDVPSPPLAEDEDLHPALGVLRNPPKVMTRKRLREEQRASRQQYKSWDPKVYRFRTQLSDVDFVALDAQGNMVAYVGLGYYELEEGVPRWNCCSVSFSRRKP